MLQVTVFRMWSTGQIFRFVFLPSILGGVIPSEGLPTPSPRYLNAAGEEEWPDEVLLPGFLALKASDLAGYLVSSMAYKLSKAILYMLWL